MKVIAESLILPVAVYLKSDRDYEEYLRSLDFMPLCAGKMS